MLHVRLVTPDQVTPRIVGELAGDDGILNLVVMRGAAERPAGDAVQFDVTTGSATKVLERLERLGAQPDGAIAVEAVEAAFAGHDHTSFSRTYHGELAPVWPVVEAQISDGARYAPSFFALLVFAGLIGACGILTNSSILIVGAMVVGPEYGAIIAVALGIERRDWRAVGRGLAALVVGFALAIAVTLLFALCIRWAGRTPKPYTAGFRPISDLINSPNGFSVVVAVVAGLAGVVSLTSSRTGALVGVFISITTIPAAADVGVSVAYGLWAEAAGSALQLLLNVGLLIAVGAVALRGQRWIWRRWTSRPRSGAARGRA